MEDERTKKLLETFKTSGPLSQGAIADVFATTPQNQPITSDTLSSTEPPIVLPEPTPQTQASRITGGTQAIIDNDDLEQQVAKETADRQAKLDANVSGQRSLLQRIGITKQEETTKGAEEFGTDVLKEQRTKAVKNLRASQVRQNAELQGLQNALNQGGQTDAGRASIQRGLSEINQRYGLEQSQYQLNYNLANSDIVAAEQTINDRIKLLQEPIYAELDLQKNVYDQISSSLSKAEDREWQLAMDDRKQAIKTVEDLEKFKGDIAITYSQNNGQPLPSYIQSKINRATNQAEVNQILSENGISLANTLDRQIKQAQLENYRAEAEKKRKEALALGGFQTADGKVALPRDEALKINKELTNTDAFKVVRKGQDSLQFLTDFETLFNKTGGTSAVFSPRQNADLQAKYNATILNLKEFFNLGVLNGPDEAILKSIIPDPTNRSAALTVVSLGIYKPSAGTKAGIANMKKQIEDTLDDRYASLSTQYSAYSPDSVTTLNDLNRIYVQNKMLVNPEVKTLITENPDLTIDEIISIINTKL